MRPWITLTGAFCVLAVLVLISLVTGVADFSLRAALSGEEDLSLLLTSRLPRTLSALLTGASMAVAGTIMQVLARNKFVEPTTAGTGECAALGILMVTMWLPEAPTFLKMVLSCATALAGTSIFLTLVQRIPPTQPLLVPLTGIVFGGVVSAITTYFAYEADLLQYIGVWMNGEFSGVVEGRYELLWASGAVALTAYLAADRFTLAGLGRDVSTSLGLNFRQIMIAGLVMVSLITAFNVITIGMLPFVGLVVPNLVSRMFGDNVRRTLPHVAFLGGTLVLACDILGRLINYPYEIPAGTNFGVLGTGVFLWLLFSSPRHAS